MIDFSSCRYTKRERVTDEHHQILKRIKEKKQSSAGKLEEIIDFYLKFNKLK